MESQAELDRLQSRLIPALLHRLGATRSPPELARLSAALQGAVTRWRALRHELELPALLAIAEARREHVLAQLDSAQSDEARPAWERQLHLIEEVLDSITGRLAG